MSYTYWRVDHIPFVNNDWDSDDTETITNIYEPKIEVALGDSKDSFEFKMTNFNGELNDKFNSNDKITIYRAVNSDTVTSADILMVGSCKDIPEEQTSSKNIVRVEGYNFSETVMSAISFVDLNNRTIANGLQHALENAAQKNINFKVEWDSNNPSTKRDGSAFPTITSDSRFFNKPLRDVVEKYSTQQATEDIDYMWYVNNENKFIWLPKSSDTDYTFDSDTDVYTYMKIGKDIKGVRNFIILKGGVDPAGNQIQTRYQNWTSIAANGMKYHILVSETNNAKQIIEQDLRESYGDDIGSNRYPNFPFTSTWISSAAGTAVTAADEDEYVQVVRNHIKAALQLEGQRFAESRQYGKLTVSLTVPAGTYGWGLGSNIECTIPNIRELPFVLRVSKIQYTATADVFELEEDIGTVGSKLT